MPARTTIEKRIVKERQKIAELQLEIERSEAFVRGLQEALQILPKEKLGDYSKTRVQLRAGSDMGKAQKLISGAGRAMHLDEIIEGIGKTVTDQNRLSISGSLNKYVRKKAVFTRSAPNTFGLIAREPIKLPDTFGAETENDDMPYG